MPLPTDTLFRTQEDAAKVLNLSPRTLERFRVEGRGPAFHKFGRRVLYSDPDLLDWAAEQRRTSTSQAA